MAKRELSEFEKAFAAARKEQGAGGTFEFKGKKYSTDTAEDKAKRNSKEVTVTAQRDDKDKYNRAYARNRMASAGQDFEKLSPRDQKYVTDAFSREPKKFVTDSTQVSSGMKRGGSVKKYAKGGSVGSASKRADGLAKKGKTKGRFV